MKTKHIYGIAAAVSALLFVPLSGRADPPADLHRLSENLEDIIDDLDDQFEDHYEDSRGYQTLIQYLSGIELRGKNIHRLTRNRQTSLQVIQQELAVISQLNNNMRGLVNQLENEAGRYALRLFGDTRDVHILLGTLNRNVQGMQRAASRYGLGGGYSNPNYNNNTSPQYSYPTQRYSTYSNQQRYSNTNRQPYSNTNRQPHGSNYNQPAYSYPTQQSQRSPNHNQPAYSHPQNVTPQPVVPHQNLNPLQKLHQKHIQLRHAIFGRH